MKNILPTLITVCVLMSLGLKNNDEQQPASLKIVRHNSPMAWPPPKVSDEILVEINGKTLEERQFLSELWKRNRPLFKQAQEKQTPRDATLTEIFFNYGKESLAVEGVPQAHSQKEIEQETACNDKNKECCTPEIKQKRMDYFNFEKGINDILEESLKFQKEHGK